MNNVKEIVKTVMRGLATAMLSNDPREWPPTCTMLVYQPERPAIQKDDTSIESK